MNAIESCSSCGGFLAPEVGGAAVCVTCALALALQSALDGELVTPSDPLDKDADLDGLRGDPAFDAQVAKARKGETGGGR